jgi:23S rRNA (guanosine2251-2'-O)-methyltransferase
METSLCYGLHTVENILSAHPEDIEIIWISGKSGRLEQLCRVAKARSVPLREVSRIQLAQLAGNEHHQGVVARLRAFQYADFLDMKERLHPEKTKSSPLWLILDHIQDPHNFGALLRTAYVMGVDAVVVPKDRACRVQAGTMKSASGAAHLVPICQVVNLVRAAQTLQEDGVWIMGTSDAAEQPLWSVDCTMPLALVLGAEDVGIRTLMRKTCDYLVQIPCSEPHFSLNVAAAGSMSLYEICRQRMGMNKINS